MAATPSNVTFLHDLPIDVVIELGRAELTVRALAQLERDDVVELDRMANQSLDVVVGGRLFARGEVVFVDDGVALKITELINQQRSETA